MVRGVGHRLGGAALFVSALLSTARAAAPVPMSAPRVVAGVDLGPILDKMTTEQSLNYQQAASLE